MSSLSASIFAVRLYRKRTGSYLVLEVEAGSMMEVRHILAAKYPGWIIDQSVKK
jgi:hypothetical protein